MRAPALVCHRRRLRSQRRQTTNDAITTGTALSPTDRVGDLGQQEEGDEADHETGNHQQQEEDRRHMPMPRTLAHAALSTAFDLGLGA